MDNTGYTVYFSDRRNNRTTAGSTETGEFGFEDFVNPTAASGAPNGTLDQGEDVNANNQLDTYGNVPSYSGVSGNVPPGAVAPLDGAARAFTTRLLAGEAQVNRAIVFRRALKLIKGTNIVGNNVTGLTVVSENPVYVQGDWNANAANDGFTGAHAATSVIADAVTLLSNSWNDDTSFAQPYIVGQPELAARRPGTASRSSAARVRGSRSRPARRPTSAPTAACTTSCGIWKTAISRRSTTRVDRDVLLQPAGGRDLQVLQHGLRRADRETTTSTATSSIRRCCRRTRRCSAT